MCFFFFNDTATTEIYTLSLHDALPISDVVAPSGQGELARRVGAHELAVHEDASAGVCDQGDACRLGRRRWLRRRGDRQSTRLNSSHADISYGVVCLQQQTSSPCCEPSR